MKELKVAWNVAMSCVHAVFWIIGTQWRGTKVLLRATRLALRWRDLVAETLPCPRGHLTPVYGIYECGCGALHEGWAFGRCRVCGQAAGWTPCVECGLPVRSPLL